MISNGIVRASELLVPSSRRKLKQIAKFLETLSPRQFDMTYWVNSINTNFRSVSYAVPARIKRIEELPVWCETTACICGHLPSIFPDVLELCLDIYIDSNSPAHLYGGLRYTVNGHVYNGTHAAAIFLGIPPTDASLLFLQSAEVIKTPKQAARMIRDYIDSAEEL